MTALRCAALRAKTQEAYLEDKVTFRRTNFTVKQAAEELQKAYEM